jgi:hypothetical protein
MKLVILVLLLTMACGKKTTDPVSTVNNLPTQVNRITTTDYCMSYQPYADTYTYARCMKTYDNGYGYYNGRQQ